MQMKLQVVDENDNEVGKIQMLNREYTGMELKLGVPTKKYKCVFTEESSFYDRNQKKHWVIIRTPYESLDQIIINLPTNHKIILPEYDSKQK